MVIADVNQTKSTDRIEPTQIAAYRRAMLRADLGECRRTRQPLVARERVIMRDSEVTVARPQRNCDNEDEEVEDFLHDRVIWLSIAQKNTFQPCFAASSCSGS